MTRPDLEVGLCGEHGAIPENIRFCMEAGLDYVSCSPVPGAAVQAGHRAAHDRESGEVGGRVAGDDRRPGAQARPFFLRRGCGARRCGPYLFQIVNFFKPSTTSWLAFTASDLGTPACLFSDVAKNFAMVSKTSGWL